MRILFMGSASISCRSLEVLLGSGHEIIGAVTQPDKPKGRSLMEAACPAKAMAETKGVHVFTPPDVNDAGFIAMIRELSPDLIAVVAYGQILKQPLLDMPPLGCINLHASLLPKYRGAAPIQWAIANGERTTGVTIMHMARKMDAGDIIMQEDVEIDLRDTGGSLHDKLADVGAPLLLQAIDAIHAGTATRIPQIEAEATYAPKLLKEHGHIDWMLKAETIYNHIRGFNPWPGCYSKLAEGHMLKILEARVEKGSGAPGTVVETRAEGPLIAAADGLIVLTRVQPESKKAMTGAAFLNGHSLKKGDRLT